MRRGLVVLLLAGLSAAVLVAGAGAAGERSQGALKLTSKTAIDRYLVSLGYNPRTFVVQRGAKNYAGARCPGATWNCTTARRVVQVSRTGTVNEFTCTPAGNGTNEAANTCVIVQVSQGGLNNAVCTERDIDQPSAIQSQSCQITQENTSGRNVARGTQELRMYTSAGMTGSQNVVITQANLSGNNSAIVRQTLVQSSSFDNLGAVSQSQSGDQDVTVDQDATQGGNSSDVKQVHSQRATATRTGGTVTQEQNVADAGPDTKADVDQSSSSGRNSSLLDQYIRQEATGDSFEGPVNQRQGSATGGIEGSVTQSSSQPSTSVAVQDEDQILSADTPSGTLTQIQFGPMACCTTQLGNENNTFDLTQSSFQTAGAAALQVNLLEAHCISDGTCNADQTVTNNDGTTTNSDSCTASESEPCTMETEIVCAQACEVDPVEGSEETVPLVFEGPTQVYTFDVTTSASSADLLVDTMDCCIEGDEWGVRLIDDGSDEILATSCGSGSISEFSGLATATGVTAYRVEVFYCEGVDVFAAGMTVRFRTEGGTATVTPTGHCFSEAKTCEDL